MSCAVVLWASGGLHSLHMLPWVGLRSLHMLTRSAVPRLGGRQPDTTTPCANVGAIAATEHSPRL
eukprot:4905113-Pyramimonas_sp.AAC.1